MKRKSLLMNVLVVTAVFWAFGLLGVQTSMAVEEHHQPGATEKSPASTESPGSGKMPGSASGSGPGMMGMMAGPDDASDQGMMGMMAGPDDASDQGMMGMMDQGMMRMMMSHMMGGPGGMGKMMGQMGAGMKGRAGAPRGMAHMLESLNLTPEQWGQVRGLARERLEKMADLWAQRMKLQIELAGLRWDKEVDSQKVKDLFGKKAEAQAEMFLASLGYLRELKAILSPEQLKKMEAHGF